MAYSTKVYLKPMIDESRNESSMWITVTLLILSIILIVVAISLTLVSIHQRQRQRSKRKRNRCECSINVQNNLLYKESGRKELNNNSTNQISSRLYEELELENRLNDGKYSIKYQAKRHGLDVFVKIYKGDARRLWLNEINIYKIILIRHENILNFIAKSEFYDPQFGRSNCYLTVTEYHQLGSLDSFLKTSPNLTEKEMLKLMLSASSGLNHLHLEISNNQRKPAIVHRNINSKNFIVKPNLTCVIANFSYALKSTELDGLFDRCKTNDQRNKLSPKTTETNRKRMSSNDHQSIVCRPLVYCPPEYLNNSINLKSIVFLKSADVYSFSLVLWQISNYFYTGKYRMPFSAAAAARQTPFHGQFDELVDLANSQQPNSHRINSYVKQSEMSSASNDEHVPVEIDELERMRYLLLEQKQSVLDWSGFDFEHDKQEMMFRGDDKLCTSPPAHYLGSTTERRSKITDDSCETKEIRVLNNSNFVDAAMERQREQHQTLEQHSPTTKQELDRIIKEASYTEPLARLSIRKIESDLKRLVKNLPG